MANGDQAKYQQRMLGYPCIFTRTVDEAAAVLVRVITDDGGALAGSAEVWLERIEGWLRDEEQSLAGLNFAGAEFTDQEWRNILDKVADGVRRHLTRP